MSQALEAQTLILHLRYSEVMCLCQEHLVCKNTFSFAP